MTDTARLVGKAMQWSPGSVTVSTLKVIHKLQIDLLWYPGPPNMWFVLTKAQIQALKIFNSSMFWTQWITRSLIALECLECLLDVSLLWIWGLKSKLAAFVSSRIIIQDFVSITAFKQETCLNLSLTRKINRPSCYIPCSVIICLIFISRHKMMWFNRPTLCACVWNTRIDTCCKRWCQN